MTDVVAAIETLELGKRYGKTWAVQDCTLSLPKGKIVALVGPNGAGKSTLLRMIAGITVPSAGSVTVAGISPSDSEGLSRVGYLDQERPLYKDFRVAEMLRFGREFNPRWDDDRALSYLEELGIPLTSRVGRLSGGQQAQVALTMCLAKGPDLLLLDEPVAALDPLARENLMHLLLRSVVDDETTVVLSSHAIADLASICDYVVILNGSLLQLAGELDHVLASHRLLIGPAEEVSVMPDEVTVVASATTGRQATVLVRTEQPLAASGWEVHEPTLEEIVIAYLRQQPGSTIEFGMSTRSSGRRTAEQGTEQR